MTISHLVGRAIKSAVDYALPLRCPSCGAITGEQDSFCAPCWSKMDSLGDLRCVRCGVPFEYDIGMGGECEGCIASPPAFDSARAVMAYGEISKTVALRLKYGRRIGLARLIAKHMVRHVPAELGDLLIVPVPLHRWRIWSRGYNQSALIADHLGRMTGLSVDKFSLIRTRATQPLRELAYQDRTKIVEGAFGLKPQHGLKGREILLVDDVQTSGATASACAKILKQGGASSVHLLSWARALPNQKSGSD